MISAHHDCIDSQIDHAKGQEGTATLNSLRVPYPWGSPLFRWTVSRVNTLSNPAPANYHIPIVENRCLPRGNGSLGFIKRNQNFVFARTLDRSGGGLVPMPDFHLHRHGLVEIIHRDQVRSPRPQCAGIEMLVPANGHLFVSPADLDDIQRRSRGHSKPLALADREVV